MSITFAEFDELFFATEAPVPAAAATPFPPQTEEQARLCAFDFLKIILKRKLPNGRNHYFPHVIELVETGDVDQAVKTLSEILRGPRFTRTDYWCERITEWKKSLLEYDTHAFGPVTVLPFRVFHNLTRVIPYDETLLYQLFDETPMLK